MAVLRKHDTLNDARRSEKYFKSGFGRKQLDRLLANAGELTDDITWLTSP